jgi:glutamyl-tRNA synthetase
MTTRVRFAPSPTGYLHIGSARTALFNWLFARRTGGKFLLRVEDTDLQRSTEESLRSIIEGLEWLGIADYDEEIVFQSANADRHREAALRLVAEGKAYRDFTPKGERADSNVKQEIAERARAQAGAEGQDHRANPFRDLPLAESERRAADGEPFAVRLRVAQDGLSRFTDAVYGEQTRDYYEIEDLVLLRSGDLSPLYNLSVVVDDIAMSITHVIRGQDHLTNTHKQILIYEALGASVPTFAHLPLILAPGGKKLSKRTHGEIVSLTTYRDAGFIPAAFRNFLALLGWAPAGVQSAADLTTGGEVPVDERLGEIMSLDELIRNFSLDRIHRNNATFTFDADNPKRWTDDKALWMNAEYLRTMPREQILPMVRTELESAGLWRPEYENGQSGWLADTVDLIRQRFFTLKDFTGQGRAYFADDFEFDETAVKKNLKKDERLRELLPGLAARLEQVEPWNAETVEAALREFSDAEGVKAGLLINASRTALTGQAVGPSMFDVFVAVGRDRSVARLRSAATLV